MTAYVLTPERLKQEIDHLVEKRGIKLFVIETGKRGTAFAPSKKVDVYRIPCTLPEIFKDRSNLGAALKGMYLLGIENPEMLNEEATNAIKEAE